MFVTIQYVAAVIVGESILPSRRLVLATLAVVLSFSGGFFNIGVDGQIYLGAIFATGAAFALGALGLD